MMAPIPEQATLTHPPSEATPLVSICIANYNGASYVRRCVDSVKSQEHDFGTEIILHDDCSTDDSVSIVREAFPDITVLTSDSNVGFCISNNRMASISRGRYLLLLNNDAVLREGSLKALAEFATRQKKAGILGLPQYSLHDGSLVDRGYHFDIFMNPVPAFEKGVREVGLVTGACLWIPRQLWKEVGGFPPWFGSVAEDSYLCCIARLLGYPVTILNGPGFEHWIGRNLGGGKVTGNKLESSVRRRALSERNKTWVMIITYPIGFLIFVLPFHMLILALEGFTLLIFGTPWKKVRTIYFSLPQRLFEHFDSVMSTRSEIQSRKTLGSMKYFRNFHLLPQKFVMLLRHGIPKVR